MQTIQSTVIASPTPLAVCSATYVLPRYVLCIALLCYGNIIDVLYNEPIMFRVHKVAIDCLFIGNSTFDVQILPCFCLKSYSLSSVIYYFEINASWHFNLVGLYISGQRCISGLFTMGRTQRSELFSWWAFIDLPKQVSTISCCVAVVLLTEQSDKKLRGISKRFMTLILVRVQSVASYYLLLWFKEIKR